MFRLHHYGLEMPEVVAEIETKLIIRESLGINKPNS